MTGSPTLTLVVLGDSIAHGQGASRPQDTIGARLARRLDAEGITVTVLPLAVPGALSADLAAQVRRAEPIRPQLALIVIGANDLTRLVPPARAATQLADAVRAMRRSGAEVVVAPAPDLSVVPCVPAQFRALVQGGSTLLRSAQSRAALAEGARVVDVTGTTAQRFASEPALFSADRFHPSSAGYEVIAAAIAPAVLAAARDVLAR